MGNVVQGEPPKRLSSALGRVHCPLNMPRNGQVEKTPDGFSRTRQAAHYLSERPRPPMWLS
jgi:hypothetical protein